MKKFKIMLQDCRFDFEQKTVDYVVALKKQGYSIGLIDVVIYLGFISAKYGVTLEKCLQSACNEIKDRRGRMVNGVFVKESDLNG